MLTKTVILDGTRSEDKHLDPILTILTNVLHKRHNNQVQIFTLREIKLNPCIGCFNCFIKTPGRCLHSDAGANILREILHSDTVIFFTPVVFGGYSSELKKIVDRLLPVVLPFFVERHGETHHPPRYMNFPHIVGLGIITSGREKEFAKCFRMLVGRNALNLPPSHYSVELVDAAAYSPETLRQKFHALLHRTENLPLHREIISLIPQQSRNTADPPEIPADKRKALLILGSPKVHTSSSSSVLGAFLVKELQKHGVRTKTFSLTGNLLTAEGQLSLCRAVEKADTILMVFPLYFDSLPFLVTKAFEVLASQEKTAAGGCSKHFLALVNNGLPESYQNAVALAICRNFALECKMIWAGGLAMGTGEGVINGKSLIGFRGFGGFKRPPLFYVIRSLKITAAALAAGQPVPEKAVQLMNRNPVPFMSPERWISFVIKSAKKLLEKEAKKNGLNKQEMLEKPYGK